MSVDNEIPTEEKLEEFKDKARLYLNDIKTPLEETMTTTTFQYIFSGSAVERYGIPFMMMDNGRSNINALYTDLDVMFCSLVDTASFSGRGNILIEPLVTEREGFTGYAQLTSLTPCYVRQCVSSKVIRDQAIDAVGNASVAHLPGVPCCCGMTELTPKIKLNSIGPAIKINIAPLFEADITLCIQCSEWPTMSDWPSRPRYWPCIDEAQRIISLGCHLVAKPAPYHKTSWRFSFSLAEVELSKLVPDTARKCFLAVKIILRDHLQPVVPEISSYHVKTIFLNTLEKVPVGFWVESNIEECLLTLLAELRDALASMNCPHHWFSFINLFDIDIEANKLQRLAKKVERIMKGPAPFILDDGCCCLSPCCVRVPHYNFTLRSREQFLAEYDEVTLSADGHMIADPGNNRYQLSVSPPRTEAQLHPSSCSSENYRRGTTKGPEQLVVSLPPLQNAVEEPSFRPGDQVSVSPPNSDAQLDSSSYSSGNHCRGTTAGTEQLVVSLPPLQNTSQELSFCPGEAEDDWFRDALPLLVILPPIQHV